MQRSLCFRSPISRFLLPTHVGENAVQSFLSRANGVFPTRTIGYAVVVQSHSLGNDVPLSRGELERACSNRKAIVWVQLALGRDLTQNGFVGIVQWEIGINLAVWIWGLGSRAINKLWA